MTKFFKIKKKLYSGVTLSKIAVAPQKLNIKIVEKTGHQTKNYSITISMQESFSQSAQFIKSLVRYT